MERLLYFVPYPHIQWCVHRCVYKRTFYSSMMLHYNDLGAMASQITEIRLCSTACPGQGQGPDVTRGFPSQKARGHPLIPFTKGPVKRKLCPFHDVIMFIFWIVPRGSNWVLRLWACAVRLITMSGRLVCIRAIYTCVWFWGKYNSYQVFERNKRRVNT